MLTALRRLTIWFRWFFSFSREDFDEFLRRQEDAESEDHFSQYESSLPSVPPKHGDSSTSFSSDFKGHLSDDEDDSASEEEGSELLALASSASTTEECWAVIDAAPDDSEAERIATEKLERLLITKLSHATTTQECLDEVFYQAPQGSEMNLSILKRALSLATTLEECTLVGDADSENELSDEIDATAEILRRKILESATDIDSCWDVFNDTEDEETEILALRRIVQLATTREECLEVIQQDVASNDDTLFDEAMKKALALSDSVEECQEIWDEYQIDSISGRAAILRAAEIIKREEVKSQNPSLPDVVST